MKLLFLTLFLIVNLLAKELDKSANIGCKEISLELKKLESLRQKIQNRIEEYQKILKAIKQERTELENLKKQIEKEQKRIVSEHFKKLAKDFENMDPEYAGEKFSKMEDPKVAAYILYNMNPRKAGDALNYVDPTMVNKITIYLTQLKKNEKK